MKNKPNVPTVLTKLKELLRDDNRPGAEEDPRSTDETRKSTLPEIKVQDLDLAGLYSGLYALDVHWDQIGRAIPRPPGLVNSVIDLAKRTIARGMFWFVRSQREFNAHTRTTIRNLTQQLEVAQSNSQQIASHMRETFNRLEGEFRQGVTEVREQLLQATGQLQVEDATSREQLSQLREEHNQLREKWAGIEGLPATVEQLEGEFRQGVTEVREQLLQATGQLQIEDAAILEQLRQIEGGWRQAHAELQVHLTRKETEQDARASQVSEDLGRLQGQLAELAQRFTSTAIQNLDTMQKVHDLSRTVHALEGLPSTLRELQRTSDTFGRRIRALEPPREGIDQFAFDQMFGGTEEEVRRNKEPMVKYFVGKQKVMDLGCGRGYMLEMLREAGVEAVGIDHNAAVLAFCRQKGLPVVEGDVTSYLAAVEDASLGGIFMGHVIEHLTPVQMLELLDSCFRTLAPDSCLIIETPNPTCLVVHASTFYMDLTHVRLVHPETLKFVLRQKGFREAEHFYSSPIHEDVRLRPLSKKKQTKNLKEFNEGIRRLNDYLFSYLDYYVVARK